jgi:hypothetical protein
LRAHLGSVRTRQRRTKTGQSVALGSAEWGRGSHTLAPRAWRRHDSQEQGWVNCIVFTRPCSSNMVADVSAQDNHSVRWGTPNPHVSASAIDRLSCLFLSFVSYRLPLRLLRVPTPSLYQDLRFSNTLGSPARRPTCSSASPRASSLIWLASLAALVVRLGFGKSHRRFRRTMLFIGRFPHFRSVRVSLSLFSSPIFP